MTDVEQTFEAWQLANHPCYTASARQGFEAGYAAGAKSMRERAAVLMEETPGGLYTSRDDRAGAIRALSLTLEGHTETQNSKTEDLPK